MQRRGGRAGQRRVGAADRAQLEHREAAHLLRAASQAARPGSRRSACSPLRSALPPGLCRSPRSHRRAGARTRTAARCAYAGRTGIEPGPAAAARSCPHHASRPVPQDGQTSSPPARSAQAAAASAQNSTAGFPEHDGHGAGPGHRTPGGARVAVCPAGRPPATQTAPDVSKRQSEHRRESRRRPGHTSFRMLTVSSRTKTDICRRTRSACSPWTTPALFHVLRNEGHGTLTIFNSGGY